MTHASTVAQAVDGAASKPSALAATSLLHNSLRTSLAPRAEFFLAGTQSLSEALQPQFRSAYHPRVHTFRIGHAHSQAQFESDGSDGAAVSWSWFAIQHVGNQIQVRHIETETVTPTVPVSALGPSSVLDTSTESPVHPSSGALPSRLNFSYNVCPVFIAPHPLSHYAPFFLTLTAFSSSAIVLWNPFSSRRSSSSAGADSVSGTDLQFSGHGELHRARVTGLVWLPPVIPPSTHHEQRQAQRAEREKRRELQRQRDEQQRRERNDESETQRARRIFREAERTRRDREAEEAERRESEEEAEALAQHEARQSVRRPEGRAGWDQFLVTYADGSILLFDRFCERESRIVDYLSASIARAPTSCYLHVFHQPEPDCNPVAHWYLGFPHTLPSAIHEAAVSTSGQLVAVAQSNGLLSVIDSTTHHLQALLESSYGGWRCCVFSADDSVLAAGCEDDTITLLSTVDWSVVARCVGHSAFVRCLYFRPVQNDGLYRLLSAAEDGHVMAWEVAPTRQRRKQRPRVGPETATDADTVSVRSVTVTANPVKIIAPAARNPCHAAPIVSLSGSHTVLARRREYRAHHNLPEDSMESMQHDARTTTAATHEFLFTTDEANVIKRWTTHDSTKQQQPQVQRQTPSSPPLQQSEQLSPPVPSPGASSRGAVAVDSMATVSAPLRAPASEPSVAITSAIEAVPSTAVATVLWDPEPSTTTPTASAPEP